MTPRVPDRRAELTDAASLRALAHPTRLRLLGLLRERGPQTAALLADVVDEAPGTLSYHLGKLAAVGLIEQADAQGPDRRERWWRATSDLTAWEPADMLDDPERAAASTAFQRSIAQVLAAQYGRYLDEAPSLPREWVAAAALGDRTLRLTVDELAALRDELEGLTERWLDVSAAHEPDDPAVEPVTWAHQAYRRPTAP